MDHEQQQSWQLDLVTILFLSEAKLFKLEFERAIEIYTLSFQSCSLGFKLRSTKGRLDLLTFQIQPNSTKLQLIPLISTSILPSLIYFVNFLLDHKLILGNSLNLYFFRTSLSMFVRLSISWEVLDWPLLILIQFERFVSVSQFRNLLLFLYPTPFCLCFKPIGVGID